MERKGFKIFFLFLIFSLLLSACARGGLKSSITKVGGTEIKVEVARTNQEQERGLSGKVSLPDDSGMLFVFAKRDRYLFWMKEMNFALDFIWISNGRVVELTENVPKPVEGREIPVVEPAEPVDNVLEVNAGFIKSHKITVGDKFEVLSESR